MELAAIHSISSSHLAFEGDKSVRAQVGRAQAGLNYQDISLSVKVSAAVQSFGAANVLESVFICANLSCRDDVEVPYYSSECFAPVCSHCGE